MRTLHDAVKSVSLAILHPFREPVTWACQRGYLPSRVRKYLPWRWVLDPFAIYLADSAVRWFPTEFDSVAHRIFWSGLKEWEKETAPVILSEVQRAKCFLDIGANCGIYSVLGCSLNRDVSVVAFEPVPKVYAALANNVKQNRFEPRGTPQNRPMKDTSKAANEHEAGQGLLYLAVVVSGNSFS